MKRRTKRALKKIAGEFGTALAVGLLRGLVNANEKESKQAFQNILQRQRQELIHRDAAGYGKSATAWNWSWK